MKIAISGKGGVGKTLISALLCRVFAEAGYSVIAVDGDPDANLGAALGFKNANKLIPVSEIKELIEERTGVKVGETAPFYKLNPHVADIPEKYAIREDGISLMVMGRVKPGGSGCYCPENALLQALMAHLLLLPNEVVIMDMAAGIEHLSRGTSRMVDKLIVVTEPGRQSIETALRIKNLAQDLGIKNIAVIGNKIQNQADRQFIESSLTGFEFLGFIPYDTGVVEADRAGRSLYEANPRVTGEIKKIYQKLTSTK